MPGLTGRFLCFWNVRPDGKLIWVIVICVGVLGGVKGIGDWYYNKSNKFEQHLTIHFDIDGAPYILDPVTNAKIWIVPTKPEK
jgi:hypothetical protein